MVAGSRGDSSNGEEGVLERSLTGTRAFSLTEEEGVREKDKAKDFQVYSRALEWMVGWFTGDGTGEEGSWLEMTQSWKG